MGTNASENEEGRQGISRRSLFAAGGAAGVAGLSLGAAPPASAAPPGPRPAAAGLHAEAVEPHLFTERPAGREVRGRPVPQVRILPIDNARFLAGARFDLRAEANDVDPRSARIEVEITGPDGTVDLPEDGAETTSSTENSIEVTYPGLSYPGPGEYRVTARARSRGRTSEATVVHEAVTVGAGAGAKNVVFFLGDGMGQPAITAARLLSKGMTEGRYRGLLEMDRMAHRGLVGTSGADSIATDSANSMSAYMTGHKSSVNAMGVYEGNDPDPGSHPRVENITELLKRTRGMAIGVATTSEIQDATPAAVWAHTRRRSEYLEIMDQALNEEQRPDVLLGGGLASLLPRSHADSRREDDRDLVQEFQDLGYTRVGTAKELESAAGGGAPEKLLGLFHTGNLNVYLDRRHIKQDEVLGAWDDQPTLVEMTEAALSALEGNDNGFFLMVEGASIDKMEHPLDGPRAVYDTIEFDQAVGVAKRWAAERDDTLIIVTADHNHSMSIVGTHDRREEEGRAANGVYGGAGFPTYTDEDGDGFPDDPDPEIGLFYGWSNHPDHTDDFRHNTVFQQPALSGAEGEAVDNPERDPGAELQTGNLPLNQTNCVHTVEDVPIFASGPGSERFNAFLDNTEVFFAMMAALGVDARE